MTTVTMMQQQWQMQHAWATAWQQPERQQAQNLAKRPAVATKALEDDDEQHTKKTKMKEFGNMQPAETGRVPIQMNLDEQHAMMKKKMKEFGNMDSDLFEHKAAQMKMMKEFGKMEDGTDELAISQQRMRQDGDS